MMRLIALTFVSCVFLTGCENTTVETTANYTLPAGLADCQIFRLESGSTTGNLPTLTVMRCPLSSTTTVTSEKYPKSVTIDSK